MTRIKSVHVMWRWRSVIAAGVLIGVVVGWMSAPGTAATATDFQATHTLIADPQGGEAFLYRAAVLARLGAVPGRVASRLGIDRRLVQSMVSTETPVGVGLLLITGRSADRAQAEALANVTAAELIVELGGPKSPLHTLEPAVASPVPTWPGARLGGGVSAGGFTPKTMSAASFCIPTPGASCFTHPVRRRAASPATASLPTNWRSFSVVCR